MSVIYNLIFFMLLATIVSGGKTYNIQTHICCNGTLFERSNKTEYESSCCGNELFTYSLKFIENKNSTVSICCNGKLHKTPKLGSHCCGTAFYNASINYCFQQQIIIPIPQEYQELTTREVCGYTEESIEFYDSLTKICCSGVLYDKGTNKGCCQNVSYDTTTNICCFDTLIPKEKSEGKTCCGKSLFNATEAMCCSEYISPKNKEEIGTLMYEALAYSGLNSSRTGCCNRKLYDYETQICCENGPITKPNRHSYAQCCGTELLTNWTGQLCVDNKIVLKNSTMEEICGNTVYNMNNHFCYNNTLVKKNNNEALCYENGLTYRINEQICGPNSIVNLTDDDKKNHKLSYCDVLKPGQVDGYQIKF